MKEITIIKHNWEGAAVFSYCGSVLERTSSALLLEAYFQRADFPMHGITLRNGDRFLEAYFTDRWYNILEIYDVEEGNLKCWYCNIATPASFDHNEINYKDLALDLLVFPDGKQLVLDMDEFAELDLPPHVERQAQAALHQLQALFNPQNAFRVENLFQT